MRNHILITYQLAQTIKKSRTLSAIFSPLARMWHQASGYRKYGLYADDLIVDENPIVQEALSRLPKDEIYKREYRFKIALNESMKHTHLPKDKWTKDDHPYLTPQLIRYLEELEEKKLYDFPSKKYQ